MAAGQKIKDETTTVAMVQQFGQCEDECRLADRLVDGASSQLMAQWGGEAATQYNNAIAEWRAGLKDVESALIMIHEAMVTYSQLTDSTEDDNRVTAGGWAIPKS